jgi:hypothetical protein
MTDNVKFVERFKNNYREKDFYVVFIPGKENTKRDTYFGEKWGDGGDYEIRPVRISNTIALPNGIAEVNEKSDITPFFIKGPSYFIDINFIFDTISEAQAAVNLHLAIRIAELERQIEQNLITIMYLKDHIRKPT